MRIALPSGAPAELVTADGAATGLVITPDLYGLRPLFDDLGARLAAQWGMTTCVVEPFPGRDLGPDPEPRFAAVATLDDDDHLRDLLEGADATGCERVALMGFCMGGMYCLKSARAGRFARIAAFYGMIKVPPTWKGPGQREPLEYLAATDAGRVLAIIGDLDPYTPSPDVDELIATGANVVRYADAEHGFAHAPERPAHRPTDAADAFARARDWLSG
ncbi:MAG: dienelactone hydrolase family protein [Ilumatobacteraceae bacterium]